MEAYLIDSGPIVALLNADSTLHRQTLAMFKDLRNKKAALLLTNFIVAETFSELSAGLGADAGRTWLRHNIWPVERVSEADERRAKEIILERDKEEISYVDATTIAVLERLGVTRVFSFKRAFTSFTAWQK